ncbi:MAG: DUF2652 domain-containing protein [Lysobacterales bacterium]
MRLTQAVLVIADISGYTDFIRKREIALVHAEQVIADLLTAVVEGSAHPLSLNKFEGDALLLHAEAGSEGDLTAVAQDVHQQAQRFFAAFHAQRQQLQLARSNCDCDACANISGLSLKVFVHLREIAIRQWRQYTELAGEPVILIHRLLKNPVPSREYLLLSESFREQCGLDVGSAVDVPVEGLETARVYWMPRPDQDLPPLAPGPRAISANSVPSLPAPSTTRRSTTAPGLAARVLLSLGVLMFGLVVPMLEINASHVYNPEWPGHARLHEVWQLATNSGLALCCLWLIWRRGQLRMAALLSGLVTGGFLLAHALSPGYGGSMVLSDGSEKMLLGINLGVLAFTLAIAASLLALFLENRRTAVS